MSHDPESSLVVERNPACEWVSDQVLCLLSYQMKAIFVLQHPAVRLPLRQSVIVGCFISKVSDLTLFEP